MIEIKVGDSVLVKVWYKKKWEPKARPRIHNYTIVGLDAHNPRARLIVKNSKIERLVYSKDIIDHRSKGNSYGTQVCIR